MDSKVVFDVNSNTFGAINNLTSGVENNAASNAAAPRRRSILINSNLYIKQKINPDFTSLANNNNQSEGSVVEPASKNRLLHSTKTVVTGATPDQDTYHNDGMKFEFKSFLHLVS